MKSILFKIVKESWFVIVIALLLFTIIHYNSRKFKQETHNISFKGKLYAKYNDVNDHNIPKLKIQCNGKTLIYDLTNDNSGLFEYIKEGDSIDKQPSSIDVRVYNSSKDTVFRLNF